MHSYSQKVGVKNIDLFSLKLFALAGFQNFLYKLWNYELYKYM
jgi:hypothetical protein